MDPAPDPVPDTDSSIIKQPFCDFLLTLKNDINIPSKKICRKAFFSN
jgi:hypothetical protein